MTHCLKQFLFAAAWDAVPTPLRLTRHRWEIEGVCNECGRTLDLRHALMECGEPSVVHEKWVRTLGVRPQSTEWPRFDEQEEARKGEVLEFRDWHPIQRGTLGLRPKRAIYTDGSATYVGTQWAAAASAVAQYDHQGREQEWVIALLPSPMVSLCQRSRQSIWRCCRA
jgi:hypothetical protein